MGYYNNNRNNHKRRGRAPHGQNYVWVVYNYEQGRNHVFTSKVQALKYYYCNQFDCGSPEKRGESY